MKYLLLVFTALWFAELPTTSLGEEVTDAQLKLLKIFRGEFISLAPGKKPFRETFQMGGGKTAASIEQPQHPVTIKYAFAVARYEVPQNLWEAVMGSNPSKWKGPRNSVEMLSFSAAQDF